MVEKKETAETAVKEESKGKSKGKRNANNNSTF